MKRLRLKRKLSMVQAAKAAGMTRRQSWYRLESGERKSVSLPTLIAVARVLKCSVDELLRKR